MKAVKIILIALAVVFIAIQFIPSGIPENKPVDIKSIANSNLVTEPVLAQLRISCFDCHSNQVKLPWYSKIAPASWMLADHINDGKSKLNFSGWEDYSNREKIGFLKEIKDEVESGNMPLKSYLIIHRDAKLNSEKITTLSSWTDEATDKILN
jgi:hypothetical protein